MTTLAEIAAALGISRTPLRGALAIPERDGLVEYSVTRRPRVADPSLGEISQSLVVMGAIEALACAAATDAQIAEVVRMQREMQESSGRLEPLEFFCTDMAMHRAIVEAAGNAPLGGPHARYNARLWRARFVSSRRSAGREQTLAEHAAIAEALQFTAERPGAEGYIFESNSLDGMWTSRVTSHVALRYVGDDAERIHEATHLIDRVLRRAGYSRPRIAVAARNLHAGDGGNFGREEIDVIEPAVRALAGGQMPVDGPRPSDTVFLEAVRGEIDAVVTMYHDKGQIALKLLGFDRGVTVRGGFRCRCRPPPHGTAFDIAGRGEAAVGAMRQAVEIACDMVRNRDGAPT